MKNFIFIGAETFVGLCENTVLERQKQAGRWLGEGGERGEG